MQAIILTTKPRFDVKKTHINARLGGEDNSLREIRISAVPQHILHNDRLLTNQNARFFKAIK